MSCDFPSKTFVSELSSYEYVTPNILFHLHTDSVPIISFSILYLFYPNIKSSMDGKVSLVSTLRKGYIVDIHYCVFL